MRAQPLLLCLLDKKTAVAAAEDALSALAEWQPELIISDLRLPGKNGIELLQACRQAPHNSRAGFVLITAFGSIGQAVEALKLGADDFITKPLDFDHLRLRVERLLDVQRLRRQFTHQQLQQGRLCGLIGRSAPMHALFEEIQRIAVGRGAVLITGESGVGKELVAEAIHQKSRRHQLPFVAVNCASVPAALMESESFGHDSGAFTGATRARSGLFAEADGGTILLDEVGELPFELQGKLLRVLQDGLVRRVGSNRHVRVDVRF